MVKLFIDSSIREGRLPSWECFSSVDAHDRFVGTVRSYPQLKFSMNEVRAAGRRIAEGVEWRAENRDEILRIFEVTNSWRDSHVLPMRSIRFSILQCMRRKNILGFTAARPKRMRSIRAKIRRFPVKLDQINDLGGCRAVLDDIGSVSALIEECRESVPHDLRQEYDYLKNPKPDGYRSHHIVFQYRGFGERAVFDGRRIELQIRTRLQHSWATAVESVGLYRGENMKAGQGDKDWLRLFQLMSAEFAYSEGCVADSCPSERDQRVGEIRVLDKKLRATGTLEDLKNTTNYLNNYLHERARYYLIRYDHEQKMVEVKPYFSALESTVSLGEIEQEIESKHQDQ